MPDIKDIKNKGMVLIITLAFGVIFLIIFGGTLSFILFQAKSYEKRKAWVEALNIAEAGANYYQWCISHEIFDCVGEKDYYDSSGQLMGKFFIENNEEISCGQTITRRIYSTGWTTKIPETKRKILVQYGRVSVAKYSYIVHENVWAGNDREIWGLYHSNGGIRMDGTNYSIVSSYLPEWVCTSSLGCSTCPTNYGCRIEGDDCVCPGVFTTTNNAKTGLFIYPNNPFDFDHISVDLDILKQKANSNNSYFKPSVEIDSQADGYHLKLKSDGTYEVWIITDLSYVSGYSTEDGWQDDYFLIADEYRYGTYTINQSCGVIFFEDNLWVSGTVNGKVTVASANLITSGVETSVVLPDNILYASDDGSDGLSIISEQNILISPQSPNNMTLKGIFIAQKGRFGRNHYINNFKDLLEIFGSTVSYGRTGTQWTSGSIIVSGYRIRHDYADQNLVYGAPPFVPYISKDFKIIKWEEVR